MIDWERLLWVFLFFFLAAFAWLDEEELGLRQWSMALCAGLAAGLIGFAGMLL